MTRRDVFAICWCWTWIAYCLAMLPIRIATGPWWVALSTGGALAIHSTYLLLNLHRIRKLP